MRRNTMALLIAAAGIAAATWLLWPRHPPTDEERIRSLIDTMAQAAEDKDVSAIVGHVSDSYRGEGGSKDELKGLLFAYLRNADFVSVIIRGLQVEVRGSEADASFGALLSRVKATEVKESDLVQSGGQEIKAHFTKEGDEWRVSKASRREIGAGEALLP